MLRKDEQTERPLHPAAAINPYTRWVHDHPAVLLAEPTPAALHERLAARPGAVVVDLGCGSGNFLLESARRAPQEWFVGFEVRFKRLVKAARKVERAGLDNVLLLRAPVERFAEYFAAGSLRAVHMNFPDPWRRRPDWKKRMASSALLATLAQTLEPDGRFHLKTDHSGYFLHVLGLLAAAPGLRLAAFSNGLQGGSTRPEEVRTEFEQLFRQQGRAVYSLALERPSPTPT